MDFRRLRSAQAAAPSGSFPPRRGCTRQVLAAIFGSCCTPKRLVFVGQVGERSPVNVEPLADLLPCRDSRKGGNNALLFFGASMWQARCHSARVHRLGDILHPFFRRLSVLRGPLNDEEAPYLSLAGNFPGAVDMPKHLMTAGHPFSGKLPYAWRRSSSTVTNRVVAPILAKGRTPPRLFWHPAA